MPADPGTREQFIMEATWHGTLELADDILARHPKLRGADIHLAAILGDDGAVRSFVETDPASVNAVSPPYGGDALNYLCLSKYLRLDPSRGDAFIRAATVLLDAGADPNTGFWTTGEFPERETALYGAAGVAHNPGLTRLLLERGADPNDEEAVYHSPETYDNRAMQLLVETGSVTAENLSVMLVRKHDWHDYEGAKWLLEHGADPNVERRRGWNAMHHAIKRDNTLEMIELLLDHGADVLRRQEGLTAIARAAREGRGDVLELFRRRGIPLDLEGVDALIAACAIGDEAAVSSIASREPSLAAEVVAMGGTLLAKFAGTCNTRGLECLLDLGVDVAAPFAEGDGYWGDPPGSLAIHVASWRAAHSVVKLLIARGSPVDVPDANGMTPLALAIRACVDSYWSEGRAPDSIRALLEAGASVAGIRYPTGYDDADALLAARGATA